MQGAFLSTFANAGIAMLCTGPRKLKWIFQVKRVNFHISVLKNLGGQDQELQKSQSKSGKGKRKGKIKGKGNDLLTGKKAKT